MSEESLSLAAPDSTEAPAAPTPESAPPAETAPSAETQAELLAGKFKSVDDLTKAYKELESKLGQPKGTPAESVDALLERVELRGDELAANWREHGKLTDDQYAALEKAGYGRKVVDDYMTGQTALAATRVNASQEATQRAYAAAGGPEQWASLTQWARDHYTEDQIKSFDARLADPATSDSAVKELLYDYRVVAGNSVSTPMVHGAAPPSTSAAYSTVDEVIEAMTRITKQGYLDEATKRRFAKTPQHLFNGVQK